MKLYIKKNNCKNIFWTLAFLICSMSCEMDPEIPGGKSNKIEEETPKLSVSSANGIRYNSAEIEVTVTHTGGDIERVALCYSAVNPTPDINDRVMELGEVGRGQSGLTLGVSLIELNHNTTYYYRAYAKNNLGKSYSDVLTFKTLKDGRLPEVITIKSGIVSDGCVTLNGRITNTGDNTDITEHGFIWSLHDNPGFDDNIIEMGSRDTGKFSYPLCGLEEKVFYYIRAFARNDHGMSLGEVYTLKQGWLLMLGSDFFDVAYDLIETNDGGYVMVGRKESQNRDKDVYVVKLSSDGRIEWENTYGGERNDGAYSVLEMIDGGFLIGGVTSSNDGTIENNHGGGDIWLFKITAMGELYWQKTFGGTGDDYLRYACKSRDGGYILAGDTDSNDGDVEGNTGSRDCWIVKLDASFEIVWQKIIGDENENVVSCFETTNDGGYLLHDYSSGSDGYRDNILYKLTATGNIEWKKSFGASYLSNIIETSNGYSFACNLKNESENYSYCEIHELNRFGDIISKKSFGTAKNWITSYQINSTEQNGYLIAGKMYNDMIVNDWNTYLFKINSDGNITWEKKLAGNCNELIIALKPISDGGYFIIGYSCSNEGPFSGHQGGYDCWIWKFYDN